MLAWSVNGAAGGTAVSKGLFALAVAVEIVAFVEMISARALFAPSDPGHLIWTLIVGFLALRLVAEFRNLSIVFGIVQVPGSIDTASTGMFIYVVALRYLYTIGDLLFVGALVATIRAYKSTELSFELVAMDYFYILMVWAIPITTYVLRGNLGVAGISNSDKYTPIYRLVAVFVGAVIASLCLVIRRFVALMGGGAVARVWNSVVAAGISRDASFLALALLSSVWRPGAEFLEQYLIWIFANCWLLAAVYQQEVVPRAPKAAVAEALS
jgi:hypothetical protein